MFSFKNKLKNDRLKRIIFTNVTGLVIYFTLISLLIYVEKDSNQSALTNYQNAIWYSLVTLTTVGYGDIFPATLYGRAIGYIFILCSLAFYGLFIGQFTLLMTTIRDNKKLGYRGTSFTGHALIVGWNEFSKMVLDQLIYVKKQVAIITNDKNDIDTIKERYSDHHGIIFTLYSDFSNFEMLEKANIQYASNIFVNFGTDTDKLVYILNVRKIYPDVHFVVTLDNADLKQTFINAGVKDTLSKFEISSNLLASYIFEPDVAHYSEAIMTYAKSDHDYDIKQFLVIKSNPYIGKSYFDVFFELKKKYNCVLIGMTKKNKMGKRQLIKNPHGELFIGEGDYLIIILNGKAYKILKQVFGVEEGYISSKKRA